MIGAPPLSLGALHLNSIQLEELSMISTGPRGGVGLSVIGSKDIEKQCSHHSLVCATFVQIKNNFYMHCTNLIQQGVRLPQLFHIHS